MRLAIRWTKLYSNEQKTIIRETAPVSN